MTTKEAKAQKNDERLAGKNVYFQKIIQLVNEYTKILIVHADNVGSSHMQKIRMALRGHAVVLMGKNTMMRKALRGHLEKNPQLEELLPWIRGNIGFVFTKGDLSAVSTKVLSLRVDAPAKVGIAAPNEVVVPAGPTGLEPTQTSFLQALNIPSKINKGQVEIVSDHLLLKKGDKVGQSEAALLSKLNIRPFTYGLVINAVYDNGTIYEPHVLELTEEDMLAKFTQGVQNVAAIGLQTHFPTTAAIPHLLVTAYKNALAIAVSTQITFKRAEKIKAYLANPAAFAAPVAKQAPAPAKDAGKKDAGKKEAPKPKEPEPPKDEEEADMGLGLFD
jgi:large subunit ribosomal protein LP0